MHKNIGRNAPCPCGSGEKYKRCCINKPRNTDDINFKRNLGNAGLLIKQGDYKGAINILNHLLSISPNNIRALTGLGITYREAHKYGQSISVFEKLVALSPNDSNIRNDLAILYIHVKHSESALKHLKIALSLENNNSNTHTNLGVVYCNLGEIDKSISHYEKALKLDEKNEFAFRNLVFTLNYSNKYTPEHVFDMYLKYGAQYHADNKSNCNIYSNSRDKSRKIKVGYLSPDFRTHSVAYFIESVLKHHSKEQFDIYGYYNNDIKDDTTYRLMNYCDHWKNIINLSDESVFKAIKNDSIDILVDLSGFTNGNRLSIFSRKPAPIQVSWIGHPNTTGLKAIDYRFTDSIADPLNASDQYYTEKLIRLPSTFLSYTATKNSPEISEAPAIKNKQVTFGSFNNFSKTTPEVLHTWATLLKETTNTCLFLKCGAFNEDLLKTKYYEYFEQQGISKNRIKLSGRNKTQYDHLDEYNNIDIALDPFPYNGTTTSYEALWMGTPFITLSGNTHAGRVGSSILTNLDLKHLIAHSTNEYIEIAKELANNITEIIDYKNNLRERLELSPLMDSRSFTKNLEKEYKRIFINWLDTSIPGQQ